MKSNTIYPPMSEREISGAAISREAATQGMVLLKNINGVLPLKGRGKIALFGNGAARTIRGGTGSGDPFTERPGVYSTCPAVVIRMWISLCVIILIF